MAPPRGRKTARKGAEPANKTAQGTKQKKVRRPEMEYSEEDRTDNSGDLEKETETSSSEEEEDEVQMAKKQRRKGYVIRESASRASSQRMSVLASRGRAPLLDSNAHQSRRLTTNQEQDQVSVSDLSQDPRTMDGTVIVPDAKFMGAEKKQEKALNTNLDLKSYIKQDLFATTKFVTGMKVMELGQPPSLKVLSYLGITDAEERALKWGQLRKMVGEGINTKRSDVCTAMKKVFLGTYCVAANFSCCMCGT